MRRIARLPQTALPILLVLATGCQTGSSAYAPVDSVRYAAIGQDPFWMVSIGDDRIVLRLGAEADAGVSEAVWPRTLPRTVGGVTTWEAGEGTGVIAIESRPGPCTGARGRRYQDHARIRLSGRELTGCGGRLLAGESE